MTTIPETVNRAYAKSTPLVYIATSDPAKTQDSLCKVLELQAEKETIYPTLLSWNIATGLEILSRQCSEHDKFNPQCQTCKIQGSQQDQGQKALQLLGEEPKELTRPGGVLILATKLPADTILFFHFAHLYFDNEQVKQAVWNLRDDFKTNARMLIMLGPDFTLPPEVAQDVLYLDEPLPTDEELKAIALRQYENARQSYPELAIPNDPETDRIIDACRGIAAFPAEQAIAESLKKAGMDFESLWTRKRASLSNVAGLTVETSRERLSDIVGQDAMVQYLRDLMNGPKRARVILRLDEFEKTMAGSGVGAVSGDSGAASYSLQKILESIEDWDWIGMLLVSPPGCGKSLFTKAAAVEFGALALAGDIGATRSKFLGESEQGIRNMLKTVYAVGQDRVLVIATCNDLESLRPELRRRFETPWYVDLLTAKEREALWPIQLKRYGLDLDQLRPDDIGWTGAEIRNACRKAWMLRKPLVEASKFILPISKSDPELIERLRNRAAGRWLSASYPGPYRKEIEREEAGKKKITL